MPRPARNGMAEIDGYLEDCAILSVLDAIVQEAKITPVRASVAEHLAVSNHLSLVENFFSAGAAIDATTRPGDQRFEVNQQLDAACGEKFCRRHDLVGLKLSLPTIRGLGSVSCGVGPAVRMGPDADSSACLRVDEGCGDLAVIHDSQRTVTCRAARSYSDSIDKTAICLDEGVETLVLLWQFQAEQFSGEEPHAHSQDLPWAQVFVHRRNASEKRL